MLQTRSFLQVKRNESSNNSKESRPFKICRVDSIVSTVNGSLGENFARIII